MSKIFVDQVDPKTATPLTLGTNGDTVDIPTGVGLTVTDEVKTNKVSPATGTALALGDSGDTITVPVGAVTSLDGAVTVNDSSNDVDFTIEGNGDDDLFFVNGGTDRIGINAGATPEAKLHIIAAGASEPAAYFEQNSANDAMVLINNSRADDGSEISLKFNRADTVQGAIGTTSEGLSFWTNSTLSEKMRIASDGKVGIGATSLTHKLQVSGDFSGTTNAVALFQNTHATPVEGDEVMRVQFSGSGDATGGHFVNFYDSVGDIGRINCASTSSVAYVTSSDYRLKENVVDITTPITKLKALKPKSFNFIRSPSITQDGFLAHELADVVPIAVSGKKDAMHPEVLYTEEVLYSDEDILPEGKNIGDVKHSIGDVKEETKINSQGVDTSFVVPLLVGALQEAITKIETLEAKVTALENA